MTFTLTENVINPRTGDVIYNAGDELDQNQMYYLKHKFSILHIPAIVNM